MNGYLCWENTKGNSGEKNIIFTHNINKCQQSLLAFIYIIIGLQFYSVLLITNIIENYQVIDNMKVHKFSP